MNIRINNSHISQSRIKYLALAFVMCLLLAGCGQSEEGATTLSTSPIVTSTLPVATHIPREMDPTTEAIKLAEMATRTAPDISTPRPTNPPPYPSVPTTIPYQVSFTTGLTVDCEEVEPHLLQHTNCWMDIVNGRYISVFAGADKHSPGSGLLIIWTTTLDGTSSTPSASYNPPTPTGAITITQVIGEHVAFIAENGTSLAFNLTTRVWEDPATLPTATLTALPTALPTKSTIMLLRMLPAQTSATFRNVGHE